MSGHPEQRLLFEIMEEDKYQTALEIHDSLSQNLTGIAMLSSLLEHQVESGGTLDSAQAGEIVRLINVSIEYTRWIIHQLNPDRLNSNDLTVFLEHFTQSVQRVHHLTCTLESPPHVPINNPTRWRALLRMIQQVVLKTIRANTARHITIKVKVKATDLALHIEDDGPSWKADFDADRDLLKSRMDLFSNIAGAQLQVASTSGGGTEFHCRVADIVDNCVES